MDDFFDSEIAVVGVNCGEEEGIGVVVVIGVLRKVFDNV